MRPGSKTLERGLQALNALADSPEEFGPRELARRLSITRSAADPQFANSLRLCPAERFLAALPARLPIRNLAAGIETKSNLCIQLLPRE